MKEQFEKEKCSKCEYYNYKNTLREKQCFLNKEAECNIEYLKQQLEEKDNIIDKYKEWGYNKGIEHALEVIEQYPETKGTNESKLKIFSALKEKLEQAETKIEFHKGESIAYELKWKELEKINKDLISECLLKENRIDRDRYKINKLKGNNKGK